MTAIAKVTGKFHGSSGTEVADGISYKVTAAIHSADPPKSGLVKTVMVISSTVGPSLELQKTTLGALQVDRLNGPAPNRMYQQDSTTWILEWDSATSGFGQYEVAFYIKKRQLGSTGSAGIRVQSRVYLPNNQLYAVSGGFDYRQDLVMVITEGQRVAPSEPPASLSAKVFGSSRVGLTWTTPSRTTKSRIEYKLTTDPTWVHFGDVEGGGTDITTSVTGLIALTAYNFRVRAENDWGAGPYATVNASTWAPTTAPATPVLKSVTPDTFSTSVINYTPVPERNNGVGGVYENTYVIYWRKTSDADIPASYSTDEFTDDITTVRIEGLEAEVSYTYKLVAKNESGESAPTAFVVAIQPINPDLPTAPTGLNVTTVNYTNQTLSWTQTNTSNILGTFVYFSTNGTTYSPWQTDPLAPNITTLTATGLATDTTYYWQVFTYNNFDGSSHYSDPATGSASTGTPPAQPDVPTLVSATALNNNSILLNWTAGANNTQDGFKIYRALVSGGSFVLAATVGPDVLSYTDQNLSAGSRYYYVIYAVGYEGDEGPSNEKSATTTVNTGEVSYASGFTLHEDSRNRIKETGGRTFITSDRDRWVTRDGRGYWYKAGLRPIRGTVALTGEDTGGALIAGSYSVYLVLARGETRSVPSAPSATLVIGDDVAPEDLPKLVIAPPLNSDGDAVECRDLGYDIFGNTIPGADSWEIYLAEENQGVAYRVARLPLLKSAWEDGTYTDSYVIDPALTINDIFGGTRRPMELQGESSLPPSCWEAEVLDNRIVATGEIDIEPTQDEVDDGATLIVSGGNKYFTLTDWDATDACIYHRLIINGIDTGWEVYDYDYDAVDTTKVTKCYIRNSDPAVNAAGFEGVGGSFTDFMLAGNPNRVYFSAFFSGEALSGLSYSPETFPPLTVFENEFFPDDNTSPNGLIAVGGVLLVGKASKWVAASGGNEPDFPLIQTQVISRGSGLNAPFSMARDANDVCYYMGDTGPYRVGPGGVEKINIRFGNTHLFLEVFDPASIEDCRGEWFNREDWYVVTGLNRIGNSGNNDGFVLDIKNGAILPLEQATEATHIKEYKSTGGEFQLMMGMTQGRLGYMFKRGLYVDGVDYTQSFPMMGAAAIETDFITGLVDTEHAIVVRSVQPRIKTYPYDSNFEFEFQIDGKKRNDSPAVFVASKTVRFSTQGLGDHVSVPSARYNQVQMRLTGKTLLSDPKAYYEIKELPVTAVIKNAS